MNQQLTKDALLSIVRKYSVIESQHDVTTKFINKNSSHPRNTIVPKRNLTVKF